jgi:hypothetical protein
LEAIVRGSQYRDFFEPDRFYDWFNRLNNAVMRICKVARLSPVLLVWWSVWSVGFVRGASEIDGVPNSHPGDSVEDNPSSILSFEEWRELNLQKSGQTQQDLGERHAIHKVNSNPQHGEDYNILLEEDLELDVFQSSVKRYKDRFNFASFDCAATIVETNKNVKGALNVLSENKDSYLLNECSEKDKFLIIELCQDILIDSVAIANFEFFSSMFRQIRVSVSDRFPIPAGGWRMVGEFEGRNVRDIQLFSISNPQIWARYVRIDFISHWGDEFYCPVSLVRIHGTTMMEQYRMQQCNSTGGIDGTRSHQANPTSSTSSSAASQCSTTVSRPPEFTPSNGSRCVPSEEQEPVVDHHENNDDICTRDASIPLSMEGLVCNAGDKDDSADVSDPLPTPEDNIYQAILKRLNLLESNTSLSLRYIDEQSQYMREILSNVDKRQSTRMEEFFMGFKTNVTYQLQRLRESYQHAMIEIQERQNRDLADLSKRVEALTYEILLQKRIWLAQTVIMLMLLAAIVLTRGTELDFVVPRGWHSGLPASRERSSPSPVWKLSNPFRSNTNTPSRQHRRSISDSQPFNDL